MAIRQLVSVIPVELSLAISFANGLNSTSVSRSYPMPRHLSGFSLDSVIDGR